MYNLIFNRIEDTVNCNGNFHYTQIYAMDAAQRADKVRVAATVTGHKPITYPIALLQKSSRQDAGQAFIQFVQSPEGQAILSKYGFTRP